MIKTGEILFSKYEVQKVLKVSEKNPVFLCIHMHMGTQRILKAISKDKEGFESLQSEVLILRSLNHPGIPHIYDMEEDNHYYYIVEEYKEGITLSDLVKEQGTLEEKQVYTYLEQLVDIVLYLHSKKPDAILHLDIQPKNLLINGEKLYLIDFGNASLKKEAKEKIYVKGTIGFAPPEQIRLEPPDERADIYGIGACFLYALGGSMENCCTTLSDLLKGCLCEEAEDRYSSIEVLKRHIFTTRDRKRTVEIEENQEEKRAGDKEKEPVVLSVIGTKRGIGTSTVAMKLAVYMQQTGKDTVYEEQNDTEMVRKIAQNSERVRYKDGCFEYEGCKMRPRYDGSRICLKKRENYVVRDEGVYDAKKEYEGILVLVGSERPWEIEETIAVQKDVNHRYLYPKERKIFWILRGHKEEGLKVKTQDYGITGIRIPEEEETIRESCRKIIEQIK